MSISSVVPQVNEPHPLPQVPQVILTSPPDPPNEPRSGDRVLATAERMAPLMAILAPWIGGGVAWANAHLQYTQLDPGYQRVVEGALLAYLPVLVARLHMRSIRKE